MNNLIEPRKIGNIGVACVELDPDGDKTIEHTIRRFHDNWLSNLPTTPPTKQASPTKLTAFRVYGEQAKSIFSRCSTVNNLIKFRAV